MGTSRGGGGCGRSYYAGGLSSGGGLGGAVSREGLGGHPSSRESVGVLLLHRPRGLMLSSRTWFVNGTGLNTDLVAEGMMGYAFCRWVANVAEIKILKKNSGASGATRWRGLTKIEDKLDECEKSSSWLRLRFTDML